MSSRNVRTRQPGRFGAAFTALLLASLSRADAPPGHYTIAADVVTDTKTGLVWQRTVSPQAQNFLDAQTYCENLQLDGQSDWRAPTLIELQTIVDESRTDPAIDTTAFSDTPSDYLWTSSALASDQGQGWAVRFSDGYTWYHLFNNPVFFVRCVR